MSQLQYSNFGPIPFFRNSTRSGFWVLIVLTAILGCERQPDSPAVRRWSELPGGVTVSSRPSSESDAYSWEGHGWRDPWVLTNIEDTEYLRSPKLAYSKAEQIDRIEIEADVTEPGAELVVAWSDRPDPVGRTLIKTRRVFRAPGNRGPTVFRLTGSQISEVHFEHNEPALRYLFLYHDPHTIKVTAVRIVSRGMVSTDKFRAQSVAGVIRPAMSVRTPASISASVDNWHDARVEVALAAEHPCVVNLKIVASREDTGHVLFEIDRTVETGVGWHTTEFDLIDLDGGITLALSLEGECERVLCADPLLLQAAPVPKPNVVLYVVDALGAGALGTYGSNRDTSRFFDRLAESSVVFDSCMANASWTKPSVVSLLTSLHPQTHLVGARSHGDVVPTAAPTLQRLMQQHGYLTASFAANPLASNLSNLHLGFDIALTPSAFSSLPDAGKVSSDAVTNEVLAWLERHSDLPYFVYIHTMDPHTPYIARDAPPNLPATGSHRRDLYEREISFNDGQFRRLHEWLTHHNLDEQTLLVFTADHGEAFDEHGKSGHGNSVYEEEVHVPLLLSHPGTLEPQRIRQPVHLVDLMPTILGHCGITQHPDNLDGRDLLATGSQASPAVTHSTRFAYPVDAELWREGYAEHYAVRENGWKLVVIRNPGVDANVLLFDLKNDPAESTDLHEEHPMITNRLMTKLSEHLKLQKLASNQLYGSAGSPSQISISDDDRRHLEALGYLGD